MRVHPWIVSILSVLAFSLDRSGFAQSEGMGNLPSQGDGSNPYYPAGPVPDPAVLEPSRPRRRRVRMGLGIRLRRVKTGDRVTRPTARLGREFRPLKTASPSTLTRRNFGFFGPTTRRAGITQTSIIVTPITANPTKRGSDRTWLRKPLPPPGWGPSFFPWIRACFTARSWGTSTGCPRREVTPVETITAAWPR